MSLTLKALRKLEQNGFFVPTDSPKNKPKTQQSTSLIEPSENDAIASSDCSTRTAESNDQLASENLEYERTTQLDAVANTELEFKGDPNRNVHTEERSSFIHVSETTVSVESEYAVLEAIQTSFPDLSIPFAAANATSKTEPIPDSENIEPETIDDNTRVDDAQSNRSVSPTFRSDTHFDDDQDEGLSNAQFEDEDSITPNFDERRGVSTEDPSDTPEFEEDYNIPATDEADDAFVGLSNDESESIDEFDVDKKIDSILGAIDDYGDDANDESTAHLADTQFDEPSEEPSAGKDEIGTASRFAPMDPAEIPTADIPAFESESPESDLQAEADSAEASTELSDEFLPFYDPVFKPLVELNETEFEQHDDSNDDDSASELNEIAAELNEIEFAEFADDVPELTPEQIAELRGESDSTDTAEHESKLSFADELDQMSEDDDLAVTDFVDDDATLDGSIAGENLSDNELTPWTSSRESDLLDKSPATETDQDRQDTDSSIGVSSSVASSVELATRDAQVVAPEVRLPPPSGLERRIIERMTNANHETVFRDLLDRLMSQIGDVASPTILFVSVHKSKRTGDLAAYLTILMASENKQGRVLLVDANVSDGYLTREFGYDAKRGYGDLLAGDPFDESLLVSTSLERLQFLSRGEATPNQFRFDNVQTHVDKFNQCFIEGGVIDSPSARAIAMSVSGVVLLAESERTTASEVDSAVKLIRKLGGNLLGCVLTGEYDPKN